LGEIRRCARGRGKDREPLSSEWCRKENAEEEAAHAGLPLKNKGVIDPKLWSCPDVERTEKREDPALCVLRRDRGKRRRRRGGGKREKPGTVKKGRR